MKARERFDAVEAAQDRLIDSLKQFITLTIDVTDLHRRKLTPSQDPAGELTQRDALVLYLAHLNLCAERALESRKINSNVERRYTHPAWTGAVFQKNSSQMRWIMAEAIALSRIFPDNLLESVSLTIVRPMLQRVHLAK